MKRYLFAFDFDCTAADTAQKSPSGINVTDAYALSVQDVLGQEGSRIYKEQGGLNNRAPSQLVRDIFDAAQDPSVLFADARNFLSIHYHDLEGLVQPDKGIPLTWLDKNNIPLVSELLVRQKLSYLLDQVGCSSEGIGVWPPPCQGFLEFWSVVQLLKQDFLIDTAVISSGHDTFIRKTFDTWGFQQPDILVTEDDIRGLPLPKEMERRVKPGQLQLALAHREWLNLSGGVQAVGFDLEVARETKSRMMYFGDDLKKDGGLAQQAGIPFGWFHEEGTSDGFSFQGFRFADWRQVALHLAQKKECFAEGVSMDAFFGKNFGQREGLLRGVEG